VVIDTGGRAHGRAQALQQIGRGLDNARGSSGSALIVTGSRRSGRTHLLDEVYRRHEGRTAFITGLRDTSLSPLAAFHPLFTCIGVDQKVLVDAVPEDRRAADDVGAIVGDLVLSALESLDAGEHPLLIAVDDADLLPPSCVAVLGYIARRLAKTRVFLVLVSGPRIDVRLRSLPQLPMYTMTLGESRALVESVTGERPPLSTLCELHRIGRGNPVDIRELCEQLSATQLHGLTALPKPVAVAHQRIAWWRNAVADVTAAQRTAITVLSIARAVEPERLIEALRPEFDPGSDLGGQLAALVSAGYVQSIRHEVQVRNNLDRAAIYTVAAPALQEDCHRIIDTHALLRERPALAVANRAFTGDPFAIPAGEIIRRTGELARAGDAALAIHVIRKALDTSDTAQRSRLAAHGLRVATEWGYFADAEGFSGCIEPHLLSSGEAAEAAASHMFLHCLREERFDEESVRNLVEALATRSQPSASVLAGIAGYLHVCRNETELARRVLAAADQTNRRDSDPALTAVLAEAHLAVCDGTADSASLQLSSTEPATHADNGLSKSMVSAHLLQQLGRHGESAHDLERLAAQATSPVERTIAMTLRVDAELFAGNIDAARMEWDEAESLVPAENCLASFRLCQRVQILGLSGRFRDAEDVADRIHAASLSQAHRANESRQLWALGQIALMRGDYVNSVSLLEQSVDVSDTVGGYWQLQRQVDLIEAFVRSGQLEMAQKVLRAFELRLGVRRSPSIQAAFARGQLLVAKSPQDARLALSRALGPRTASAPALERARAHAIYAARLRDDADIASYQHHRRTAHALFTRIGAVGWIDGVGSEQDDQPTSPLLAQLTEQEREIVDLALQGLRNRDIGRRILISQRTVEKRLTAVFRKLEIRSRGELFALVEPKRPRTRSGSDPTPLTTSRRVS